MSDVAFWERIADMPHVEAIEELQARRAELVAEKADRDGSEDQSLAALLTRINAEIKRINLLRNRVQWKDAVKALYGQDAYDACAAWIAQQDPLA